MSQLYFECRFKSPAMRSLDLPVEVRKPNFALIARSVISQPVEVIPGIYHVTIKMPAGQEMFKEVKVGKNSKKVEVILAPKPKDESPNEYQELQHFFHKSLGGSLPTNQLGTGNLHQPFIAKVRAFSGNLLMGNCNEINTDSCELSSSGTDGVAQLKVQGDNAVLMLQLLQPGQPVHNILLPASSANECTIFCRQLLNRVIISDFQLSNGMADLLMHYCKGGYVQEALTTATSDYLSLERLLEGDTQDGIAATVKAYTILKFGEIEQLNNWTEKLINKFAWLPDSVVIRGEYLARLGEHKQALAVFLQLPSRGLPVFSDGFSYIIDRLRTYINVGENHFISSDIEQAQKLLEQLQKFGFFADFNKPFLTFSGIEPLKPNVRLLSTEQIETIEGLELTEYLVTSMSLEEQFRLVEENHSRQLLVMRLHLERVKKLFVEANILVPASTNVNYKNNTIPEEKYSTSQVEYIEIEYTIKKLESIWNNSCEDEDLESFKQVTYEIEQDISKIVSDLDTNIVQPSSDAHKTDLIQRLQNEIARLKELQNYLESIKVALAWLNPTTRGSFLGDLSKQASEPILRTYPELINLDTPEGYLNFTYLCLDIKNFMFLIHGCLLMGKSDLINYAIREKKLPSPESPLPITAYAAAFIFIRNKVDQNMSGKPAEELKKYLNYLMENLSQFY